MILICLVAFFASFLTLFSGFGLGTLLMPVVAIFFPIEIAIAITAIVHLANNAFKLVLVAVEAKFSVIMKFGLPAVIFSFIGAFALQHFITVNYTVDYHFFGIEKSVSLVNFVVGCFILFFVFLELSPRLSSIQFSEKSIPFGGALSGLLGGFSGHQGAFRSMFLLRLGLTKQQFIATGVVIAVLVDIVRLSVYGNNMITKPEQLDWTLIGCASLSAFIGAFVGKKFLKKITIASIQKMVAFMLVVIALMMMCGFL